MALNFDASKELFTQKFKPTTIKGVLLLPKLMEAFSNGIYNHFLFHGSPGLGKSVVAKILAQDYQYKYWNISNNSSVDILREQITSFCEKNSFNSDKKSDFKVVILDEIEGASEQFFKALRGFMDDFGNRVRFIATTNYFDQIPEPIRQRFEKFKFDPETKEEENVLFEKYVERISWLLSNKLEIKATDEVVRTFVKKHFPSFRPLLQSLQNFYVTKKKELTLEDLNALEYVHKDLFDVILKIDKNQINILPQKNYEFVMGNYSGKSKDILNALGNQFVKYISENYPEKIQKIPNVVIRVADYMYKSNFATDRDLNMLACIFHLQKEIHS